MNLPYQDSYPAPRISVQRIVYPDSVAVIGASEDCRKFGGRIFNALVHHKFGGRLFPINPGRATVFGVKSYPAISLVPEPVDLVLIAVPAELLLDTVGECARAGVGACVIVTAKMAEFDAAGAALQEKVVHLARQHGMRIIGPNCMGIINPGHALALSSTATLTSVPQLKQGGVAFASQSGALLGALLILGQDHGIGFSSAVSVGNQADLELCDFLEFFIEDEATTTICLYVEAFKDPSRFKALALWAREKGKPILVVKAGQTEVGQTATQSHTASLAGSFTAFAALCESVGVLVLDEPDGMILTAGFLDKASRLPPTGNQGVGLIASSGGGGAILADRLVLAGLPLVRWSEATQQRLAEYFLPQHINNPIDLGSQKGNFGLAAFSNTIEAIADDPGVTIVTYLLTPQPMMMETADSLISAYRKSQKPFLVIIGTSSYAPDVRARLTESGIPVVSRVDDALRVIDKFLRWQHIRSSEPIQPPILSHRTPALPPLPNGSLSEQEAKRLLGAYGIQTNQEAVAANAEAAVRIAGDIGYPVVIKGISRHAVHKSDLGLVELNLLDAAAVRQAFDRFSEIGKRWPGEFHIVIAEQVAGGIELVLGSRFDPEYGPQVLVGFGGVLVEVVKDFATAPAPLNEAQALALIEKLQLFPLLNGVRGRPKADLAALVHALSALSRLAHDLGPQLIELDINPLIVLPEGQGAVAVDGRATLAAINISTPLQKYA